MSGDRIKIAEHIMLSTQHGMVIDGRLFPYAVGVDAQIHCAHDEIAGVTVFIPAKAVSWHSAISFQTVVPVEPVHSGPFIGMDVASERARLNDLGRRIEAIRRRTKAGTE